MLVVVARNVWWSKTPEKVGQIAENETTQYTVLKFPVKHVCTQREEVSANFVDKVE